MFNRIKTFNGIKNRSGIALIGIDFFLAQVAWLYESIAPDKSPKEMKQCLSDYYSNKTLTQEEHELLIKRAKSHPKMVSYNYLFKLTILFSILDYY